MIAAYMIMFALSMLFCGAMFRILESHFPDTAVGRVIAFAH